MKPRFIAETGIEVPAVTADEMREVGRIAIEETGPNLFQMMENAGRTLAGLTIETLGDGWPGARVIVLAGTGGNGGGGICAARHLANRRANVGLCLADPDRLGDVPAIQRKVFQSTGGAEINAAQIASEHPDLIVDALIGYGLRSAPQGAVAGLIEWANATNAPVLALDLPSGTNATTGEHPGVSIEARWTLTLALPKTGLETSAAGELWLADIGIPDATYRRMGLEYVSPFGGHFRVRLTRAGPLCARAGSE
jgi:NAD(P)H-hydrate epimerase